MPYVGKNPTIGNFVKLDAITTSATATYNLLNGGVAYSPQSPNHCIVSLNGVIQSPTSAYTISGSTIVFDSALTSNDVIDFILVLGDVLNIGTPSDATVGFAKVTSNLITGATAETSIAGDDTLLIYDDSAAALRKMTRTNFIGGGNTPAFYVKGSNTDIGGNTETKLTGWTEVYDLGGAWDNTNSKFLPTEAGYYYFVCNININYWNSTIISALIRKNGTTEFWGQTSYPQTVGGVRANVQGTLYLNGTTDYVEAGGYQYLDLTNDTLSGGNTTNYFFGFKLIT